LKATIVFYVAAKICSSTSTDDWPCAKRKEEKGKPHAAGESFSSIPIAQGLK
jgi:hypothetical protein